jgi:hypothetical protein
MAHKRTLIERSRLEPWRDGPVRDWTTSPRLFTGRPGDASKPIAERLMLFLDRYQYSSECVSRLTKISSWAIRQARDEVRSLPVINETLTRVTIERIEVGRLWLRRETERRRNLEWTNPPYKSRCPTQSLTCHGGTLPGSCYRQWKVCPMSKTDWEAVEKIHEGYADRKK